jgi:hypothetical protein
MAYVESFLLYIGLVLIGGIILLFFLLMLLLVLDGLRNVFLKKERIFSKSRVLKKVTLVFISIYLVVMSIFYIQRANTLLFSDRPYKEAKAYAIAGEYVFLYKALLLNIVNPSNSLMKPFNTLEAYILHKIYTYIPASDAEREIWNYKFNLIDYARTMYAPMVDADIKKGLSFTNPTASMKPELLIILNNIYNAMDNLSKKSIKDKEFSEIDRYLVIAALAPYYKEYMLYEANLHSNWKDRQYYGKKWKKIYSTPRLKSRFMNYIKILDTVYKAFHKDKNLAKAFERYPRLKASYYWAATNSLIAHSNIQTSLYNIYPCTNPTFLKWVENYKEFVKWAYMTPGSSFMSLSKRDKKNYAFKIEDQESAYYIAKYICKIPFKYMIQGEAHIRKQYRKSSFRASMEMRSNIIHIRKLQKKLNTGESHE